MMAYWEHRRPRLQQKLVALPMFRMGPLTGAERHRLVSIGHDLRSSAVRGNEEKIREAA
ncbi:MAG: hypothetical protein ACU837_13075 [Gammaproteobacteria bacterium]